MLAMAEHAFEMMGNVRTFPSLKFLVAVGSSDPELKCVRGGKKKKRT